VFVGYDRDLFVVLPRDADELDTLIEAFTLSREGSIAVAVGRAARTTGWASDAGEPRLPRYALDQQLRSSTTPRQRLGNRGSTRLYE
jgi:hypothetical protein